MDIFKLDWLCSIYFCSNLTDLSNCSISILSSYLILRKLACFTSSNISQYKYILFIADFNWDLRLGSCSWSHMDLNSSIISFVWSCYYYSSAGSVCETDSFRTLRSVWDLDSLLESLSVCDLDSLRFFLSVYDLDSLSDYLSVYDLDSLDPIFSVCAIDSLLNIDILDPTAWFLDLTIISVA